MLIGRKEADRMSCAWAVGIMGSSASLLSEIRRVRKAKRGEWRSEDGG